MRKEKLVKRLQQISSLEFVNAFFLPLVFWSFVRRIGEELGLNSIMAMAVNGIIFDKIGSAFFMVLATLEYINYFEVQLMYDNKSDLRYLKHYRRLKEAKLKRLISS